eukprot:1158891-Pelagomonas_calceolata.AAC.6
MKGIPWTCCRPARSELPSTASQLEKLRANAELYCASTHQVRVFTGAQLDTKCILLSATNRWCYLCAAAHRCVKLSATNQVALLVREKKSRKTPQFQAARQCFYCAIRA